MRRFGWQWLAASSLLVGALAAAAETRPQYGGTLRLAVREVLTTLDPGDGTQPDSFARRNLTRLMFETLVTIDDNGRVRPGLATSWQALPGTQRWQFRLRRGVMFHDGSALTPEVAATSLRTANPSWNVSADADSIIVECKEVGRDLPAELAQARNAIVKRNAESKLSGTGPFHITDWQPGKKLTLAAEENYWRGRPFLDAIDIEMGENFHDQLLALELGRADMIEIAPEQSRRVAMEGRRVASSAPMELVALLFARDPQSDEDKTLRSALALSVDRSSMRNVLLQGAGQPAGGILPNWMTGYGFVFATETDLPRARHACAQVSGVPAWTIGYDGNDSISRLLVDRIALNARDAGLKLQPTSGAAPDLRLVRIPLAANDPWISLEAIAESAGLPPTPSGGSVDELHSAEQALLATQRLIPLFHLPVTYAASPLLRDWQLGHDGSWNLAGVWLESEKP